MSENIGIGSYRDLSDGASTIRSTTDNLKRELENGNGSVSKLRNPRVLEGPIGEHINGIWNKINTLTNNNINYFEKSAGTLNHIEDNYHETDKKSSDDVGGVL